MLSLAFQDNKRQRYIRDGKKCFVTSVSGPNNVISWAEQRGCLVIHELSLMHSRGEKQISKSSDDRVRMCNIYIQNVDTI